MANSPYKTSVDPLTFGSSRCVMEEQPAVLPPTRADVVPRADGRTAERRRSHARPRGAAAVGRARSRRRCASGRERRWGAPAVAPARPWPAGCASCRELRWGAPAVAPASPWPAEMRGRAAHGGGTRPRRLRLAGGRVQSSSAAQDLNLAARKPDSIISDLNSVGLVLIWGCRTLIQGGPRSHK
ncbi:hypothetical protein C2845_PM14G14960 [Panicum miliaceum]|uniref:Uncharacterized protein n=1 Tax=Panicum miliaceum TaxID=4540 RepID=A0A3L6PLX4_PANMI|nr:hypothetical protein C2845_PM14G14960 [Panicum miliaceum]